MTVSLFSQRAQVMPEHATKNLDPFWALERVKSMYSTGWKRFESLEEAKRIAKKARAEKDSTAVKMGKQRAHRRRKVIAFPQAEKMPKIMTG